ncbi:glycoside hydrolase family 25 protein [Streptosporangium lutulentum]|uniref:GH25 family lysozyme M1 (1,4-beta-N-acetylmuramidase) n=1 Tax=Streptosporangium lutulentum TaxID=1461250 RepID=A0ABT9Q7L2_9ACTN|nr:GH25 family lysozyme [Streptosporangium lutulentum]MDP9842647.1 GH25 family lysozyme M1 (1,4-beta-N-acetylmuramidase) [Streptosporangium lutulentum]
MLKYRFSRPLAAVVSATVVTGAILAGHPALASDLSVKALSGVVQTPAKTLAAPINPGRADALTYGQDVSNYEPDHDWNASPAKFGIVKATEGLHFRDKAFTRHWRELAKKGIVRGAYHFGHPADNPITEADFFLSVVNSQPAKPGDLLVLDLETTDGRSVSEVNAWAKAWLARVQAKTGVKPMVYSSWNFANTYGAGLSQYPLWVAYYGVPMGDVPPPADWKTWTIHQYTETPIDQDVSSLTPDQLRSLGRPPTA